MVTAKFHLDKWLTAGFQAMSAASINVALIPSPHGTGQMGGIAQQETAPIAQPINGTFMYLEIGSPPQIA